MAHPEIVSREDWLTARKAFLAEEKALTRHKDRVNAARRRLPMVEVTEDYVFDTPDGTRRLLDLFEGRRQLIVYHFMLGPDPSPPDAVGKPWEDGCPGCSQVADNIGALEHLHARDTSFVMVSRARLSKIEAFKTRMGWIQPWVSSFGSRFNHDFHVTLDERIRPVEYNYKTKAELAAGGWTIAGEEHGLSVFLRVGDRVFHTYSQYARATEDIVGTLSLLDLTAYGRQEDWEDSPDGWPQTPIYGWQRLKDRYGPVAEPRAPSCCGGGG